MCGTDYNLKLGFGWVESQCSKPEEEFSPFFFLFFCFVLFFVFVFLFFGGGAVCVSVCV